MILENLRPFISPNIFLMKELISPSMIPRWPVTRWSWSWSISVPTVRRGSTVLYRVILTPTLLLKMVNYDKIWQTWIILVLSSCCGGVHWVGWIHWSWLSENLQQHGKTCISLRWQEDTGSWCTDQVRFQILRFFLANIHSGLVSTWRRSERDCSARILKECGIKIEIK